MDQINYVIAAWTGPRRGDSNPDGSFYLREHIKSLKQHRHNLAQITIAIPDNPKEDTSVRDFIDSLHETKIQNTPVVVIRRPNIGLSYGCYSDVFEKYRLSFDYYLLIEDDYAFVRSDFDRIMLDMLKAKSGKCGFLCGRASNHRPTKRWRAQISNGLAPAHVLEAIYKMHKCLPYQGRSSNIYCPYIQLRFSWAFEEAGYRIEDFTDKYRSPAFDATQKGKLLEFVPLRKEYLMKPMQMIAKRN